MDLHLDLPADFPSDGSVRATFETALRGAVASGRLRAGLRLPSSRTLAADLGVARGTVVEVYEQLTAEGWLSVRRGAGTFVAELPTDSGLSQRRRSEARPAARGGPFRPGTPDLSAFPRHAWADAVRRTIAAVPDAALGYGDPRGPAPVRQAVASYLARVRGVAADPDRLLITTGLAQGISLTATVLADRSAARTAVENPGSDGFPGLLRHAGHEIHGIAVDGHGLRTDLLHTADVDTVLATPAHQFPLGVVLAPQRRHALAEWSHAGGIVIEDDYDAEFRYDRRPVGAFQPLAAAATVYAGSVSKALAPALRLGWMVAPSGLLDDMVAAKAATDLASPALDAYALALLLSEGTYDRHVRDLRRRYRDRRDAVLDVLAAHAWLRPAGIAAGLHLVAEIVGGPSASEVAALPAAQALGLVSLDAYTVAGSRDAADAPQLDGLVIGYGALSSANQRHALAQLDAFLRTAGG